MKKSFWIAAVCSLLVVTGCVSNSSHHHSHATHHHSDKGTKTQVVDAGCGQCLLGLREKKGCDLAVRLDGKSYFVDGYTMKQLGDAHANDGMCNTIRKAKVAGEVVNGRFAASSFELLPATK